MWVLALQGEVYASCHSAHWWRGVTQGERLESPGRRPKHPRAPPFSKALPHKRFNWQKAEVCFSGTLPAGSINILIRESQKLLNSLQAENLKSERGLSRAHPGSVYKSTLFQLPRLPLQWKSKRRLVETPGYGIP